MHRAITNHFWTYVAPRLTYAWCDVMAQQKQMLIDEMRHHMDSFLRIALRVSQFECVRERVAATMRGVGIDVCVCACRWALEICEILLENKECWIDVLSDEALRCQFWNSIAALQTHLLRSVVSANIERLVTELTNCRLVSAD